MRRAPARFFKPALLAAAAGGDRGGGRRFLRARNFPGEEQCCYRDLFVNEMGHVRQLQRNELATAIYRNNVLVHDPARNPIPEALPWIAGPAVLFRERVWH